MPKTPDNARPVIALTLAVFLALALATASLASGQASAQVGMLHPDGTITLDKWKFKEEISNGLPVAEIDSEISNGLIYVGLYAKGGCHSVLLPLWDSTGALLAGSGGGTSGPLFLHEGEPVALSTNCKNDGCEDLSFPGYTSARCEREFPSPCTCVVRSINGGKDIKGPQYCQGLWALLSTWSLADYLWPIYIQP